MPINTGTYDESIQLNDETIQKQYRIFEHLLTLEDNHHTDDQSWFQEMIRNCHNRVETEEIDL